MPSCIFNEHINKQHIANIQGWRVSLLFKTGDISGAFREVYSLLVLVNNLNNVWIWPWCAKHILEYGWGTVETVNKSVRFWSDYLKKHPTDITAQRANLLGLWYLHSKNTHTTTSFYEFKNKIITLVKNGDPDPAFLWDRLGHWAQDDNDWVEAEIAYRKATELNEELYGYCLGVALIKLERCEEALLFLLPQAKKYFPDELSWFNVASAYEGLKDIDNSIIAYKKALSINPTYDLALFNLGGIYWNKGDISEALDLWRKAIKLYPDHKLTKHIRENFLKVGRTVL